MSKISFNKTEGAGVIDVEAKTVTTPEAAPATEQGKVYANPQELVDELRRKQNAPIPVPEAPANLPQSAPTPACGVPATIQSGAIAPAGMVLGDTIPDFKDIILPRINIVQGIGHLKDMFPIGAIVFGQNTVLFTPPIVDGKTGNIKQAATPPVLLTVLGFRPVRFVEKVQGGVRGLIVNSEAEIRAAGGTLDYKEWNLKKGAGMKRFETLAEALIAIERPEHIADDDTIFVYPVEDGGKVRKFALALWAMKGTAYTAAAKRVFFTARAVGSLRKGYPTRSFNLTTVFESFDNGNGAWVPVCLPAAESTPAFMEFARAILNPTSA